jgi:hypothetical protein
MIPWKITHRTSKEDTIQRIFFISDVDLDPSNKLYHALTTPSSLDESEQDESLEFRVGTVLNY